MMNEGQLDSSHSSFIIPRSSLVPQRLHRVYLRRPPRGQVAGEEGDQKEEEREGRVGRGVCGRDAVDYPREQTRERKRPRGPRRQSRAREREPLPHDEAEYVAPARAEGHTDAYLVSALTDRVGDEAVDSDGRERERHEREDAEQRRLEPAARDRSGRHLLHRQNLRQRY